MGWGKRRELECEVKVLLFLVTILIVVAVLHELGITIQDAMEEILGQSGL